jgi:choice-of-anchor C domain-containing protein
LGDGVVHSIFPFCLSFFASLRRTLSLSGKSDTKGGSMKKIVFLLALTGACTVVAVSPAQAATNLIVDGGFEMPSVTQDANAVANGYLDISTNVGAWTVESGDVNTVAGSAAIPIAHTYWWQPGGGAQSLDLNGNGPGKISQTISTTLGTSYTLTFKLAGSFYNTPETKTVKVATGSSVPVTFTFDATATNSAAMGWVTKTLAFTATTSTTAISFESLTPGAAGVALDDIIVVATGPDPVIPEAPLALLLPLAGFSICAIALCRRRTVDTAA